MPTDPAILAQRQTLWGEPVTETNAEADSEAAFVPSEWQPSPIPPTRRQTRRQLGMPTRQN